MGSAAVTLLFFANVESIFFIYHLGFYSPFWTLSVEEQFYLFWPAVVGRVSVRALTWLSVTLCIIEPFLRWLTSAGHLSLGNPHVATYLIADNLALGALAAIFARSSYSTLRNGIKLGAGLCTGGLILFAAAYPLGILHRTNTFGNSFQTIPWNIFFTGVLLLSLGLRSPLASSFWTAPLRFLGYISYSLYLIHLLVFVKYDEYVLRVPNLSVRHLMQGAFTRFFLAGGLAILIAWLSRRFYEEQFLRMGRSARPAEPSDV